MNDLAFIPHRYCYLNDPWLLGTMVTTDASIFLSYLVIGVALYWIAGHLDLLRGWMFYAFATFIFFCGLGHAVDIWVLFKAYYWVQAAVRVITAVASVTTAVAMFNVSRQLRELLATQEVADGPSKSK